MENPTNHLAWDVSQLNKLDSIWINGCEDMPGVVDWAAQSLHHCDFALMPHCVFVKYAYLIPCIGEFVPACALEDAACFDRAAHQLLGFPNSDPTSIIDFYRGSTSQAPAIDADIPLSLMLRNKKMQLVEQKLDRPQRDLLITHISMYNSLLGRRAQARRFSDLLDTQPLNW